MSNIIGHMAGFYHAQICFRDNDGYPMGTVVAPDSVADGTTTHAYKLAGPVEVTAPSPTAERATFFGGQAPRGARDLGISDLGTFEMTLAAQDPTFHAYVTGSTLDTTSISGTTIYGGNILQQSPPSMMLGLTVGFTTLTGAQRYTNLWYHNVQIRHTPPGANQNGGQNPNPRTYQITVSTATRGVLGRLFSGMSLGLVENTDSYFAFASDNPYAVTTYTQAAAATEFILGYLPVSSETGAPNSFTEEGATSAPSAVSTSTAAVTITAADAGDRWVAAYPTNFVAVP